MLNESINRRDAIKKTTLLLGVTVSASTIAGIMNGCKADPKAIANGLKNWKPTYFSEPEGQLIALISECIIPKTDTPGAIDTGVYSFIDVYFKECETAQKQTEFKEGLAAFEQSCNDNKGKSFLKCNNEERIEMLKKEEAKAFEETSTDPAANTFWFAIKELTFTGFFTSEEGSKQFLKYDPIPGDYQACIPLEDVGGTWYTR